MLHRDILFKGDCIPPKI